MNIDQTIVIIEHGQRIGFFSDIHGNDTNLSMMFKKHPEIKNWFCLGDAIDLLGAEHNNHPTLRKMLFKNVVSIYGNHERDLLNNANLLRQFSKEPRLLDYIKSFSFSASITYFKMKISLYHATPEGVDDNIDLRSNNSIYEEKFKDIESDIIFTGHTHEQFEKKIKSKRIINPGALEDGRYCLLDYLGNIKHYQLTIS